MSRAARIAKDLHDRGFDKSSVFKDSDGARVGCSQCEALVINGIACHETDCPNARSRKNRLVGCGEFDE